MKPLISIIVPSYNHGRYIGACIDSIMFQDYDNLEIIITDDASTDNSVKVVEAFLSAKDMQMTSYAKYYDEQRDCIERSFHRRYRRQGRSVRFIRGTENIGSTANYNRGMKAAAGEYCTFVAADDLCHPSMVSELSDPLIRGVADFTYADMFIIDDEHRILREFLLPDYSFGTCFQKWYLCGVATLYRKSLHQRFGYYDPSAMADDHECYLRFAINGARFMHVPKTLYSVRSHQTRPKGLHEPTRFEKLLEHSKKLVLQARESINPEFQNPDCTTISSARVLG
jgi:glycosyltransferase involved in cell wall biosynthesis